MRVIRRHRWLQSDAALRAQRHLAAACHRVSGDMAVKVSPVTIVSYHWAKWTPATFTAILREPRCILMRSFGSAVRALIVAALAVALMPSAQLSSSRSASSATSSCGSRGRGRPVAGLLCSGSSGWSDPPRQDGVLNALLTGVGILDRPTKVPRLHPFAVCWSRPTGDVVAFIPTPLSVMQRVSAQLMHAAALILARRVGANPRVEAPLIAPRLVRSPRTFRLRAVFRRLFAPIWSAIRLARYREHCCQWF